MQFASQVAVPLILAFMMFTLGLSLVVDDFVRIKNNFRVFMVGQVLQIIALPLIAFGLVWIWIQNGMLSVDFAIGIIILAACPGGVTSNLMTYLSKGDSALSISLTAVNSLFALVSVPIVLSLGFMAFAGESSQQELSIGKTVMGMFFVTTVPVLLGMLVRAKKPDFAIRFEKKAGKISAALLFVLVGGVFASRSDKFVEYFFQLGPIIVALNIVTMALAATIAKILKVNRQQMIAMVFECGLQSSGLAFAIAISLFQNEDYGAPAAFYTVFMYVTGGAFLYWARKDTTPQATDAAA